jgi:tight adherence protein B
VPELNPAFALVSLAAGGLVGSAWGPAVGRVRAVETKTARALRGEMTAAGMDPARLPDHLLAWRGLAAGILAGGWWGLGMPPVAGVLAGIALLSGPWWVRLRIAAYRRRVTEQVAGVARSLAGQVRAGLPLHEAVGVVARDTPAPLGDHLRRTALMVDQGVDVGVALAALKAGCRVDGVIALAVALRVAEERGGRLADVLDRIAHTAEEVARVERKREADTAAGRLMVTLLGAFPALFLGLVALLEPGLAEAVFTTTFGQAVLAGVAAIVYLSVRWAARILGRVG